MTLEDIQSKDESPTLSDSTEDTSVPESTTTEDTDSTATDTAPEDQPKSLLDAVRAAVADEATEDGVKADTTTDDAVEPVPESDVPFKDDPRWIEASASHKTLGDFREYLSSTGIEIDDISSGAQMIASARAANLTKEEVANGFEIMRLIRSDPAKALEALTPYFTGLQQVTGAALPEDLTRQVEEGYISEELAKDMAQLRATNARIQAASEASHQQEIEQRVASAKAAASSWEDSWKASDPDYAKKQERVLKEIEFNYMRASRDGNVPHTPEQVRAFCNRALETVNTEIRGMMPAKAAVIPPKSGLAPRNIKPVPKSMREAMEQAIGS